MVDKENKKTVGKIAVASAPAMAVDSPPPSELLGRLTYYVGALLLLCTLTAFYFAAEIVLPIFLAFMLNLVFRPAIRMMRKLKIPNTLAAMVVIFALIGGAGLLGTALSGPASDWGEKIPNALPQLKERLHFLIQPVATIQKTVSQAENVTAGPDVKTVNVAVKGEGLSDKLFSSTRVLLGGIFETLLVLFFFLISGDTFLQRFVEILPRFQDKKKVLEISRQIEGDIASYLRTITAMNFLVGLATTLIMYVCGVQDPILWGAIAFLFNFVPILGPLVGVCLFALVGLLSGSGGAFTLLPPALYLVVHLIEGEMVTPLILSRRFTLNPALVIVMMIFWFWLWGVAGAILATPMLAILKIICDRSERLKSLGHLIEG